MSVVTSFAAPAIDIGTTPTRWMILGVIDELYIRWRSDENALKFAQNHAKCHDTRHDETARC